MTYILWSYSNKYINPFSLIVQYNMQIIFFFSKKFRGRISFYFKTIFKKTSTHFYFSCNTYSITLYGGKKFKLNHNTACTFLQQQQKNSCVG